MTVQSHQLYSIKDLENFTQIKAHTIRIWEQRYALLNPSRTESNVRLYNEADLKKILNIKLLYANGFKISKIAALTEEEIVKQSKSIIENARSPEHNKRSNDLILKILDFNGAYITSYLKKELKKVGMTDLYLNQVIPLMKTLGDLWQVSTISIVHEHYFSNVLREFILSRIERLPAPPENAKKALLFLHDAEEHEFSILFYHYLLKKRGINCYYLGPKTPISEIKSVQKHLNPTFIISTFTAQINTKTLDKILLSLSEMSQSSQVMISGQQLSRMKPHLPKGILLVETTDQLFEILGAEESK